MASTASIVGIRTYHSCKLNLEHEMAVCVIRRRHPVVRLPCVGAPPVGAEGWLWGLGSAAAGLTGFKHRLRHVIAG